ncbi:flagellin domain protein [Methanothermococcus okinawensis IH1]|uniref:Flagellin n=1 Tax=Methanothermococcus okinawensis (strain DSM 14208 / JCM 11175 / IH1) TaxID=647113 RepID=F8AMQ1_METOI|nr:flagellin domain protein [Methanothermococcus okinawensis IH1]
MKIKILEFLKNKKGASGIGTLIVFIAMVLVAAVAASVLINTSGFLQQKASTTGKQSTEQVASGLQVLEVMGMHNTTNINKTAIYISPNAGSAPIDLSQAVVMVSDGSTKLVAKYNSSSPDHVSLTDGGSIFNNNIWSNISETEFGIIVIQDADGSCKSTTPVINKGDIVAIALNTTGLNMGPRSDISGTVQPEFGAPGVISFTTPATYLNNSKVVQLQ